MKIISFMLSVIIILSLCGCQAFDTTDKAEGNDGTVAQSSNVDQDLISKDNLEDWGKFDSINSLITKTKRNKNNPQYVLVNMIDFYVIRDISNDIYIVDKECIEDGGVKVRYAIEQGAYEDILSGVSDNKKIKVIMRNDNSERVVSGDIIQLSGVFDTKQMMIIQADYEMIKAVE